MANRAKYKVTEHDKYGIRKNHYVLFKQRAHSGFDITADIGTEVHPIADGTVLLAEFDGTTTEGFDAFNDGYGNKVEILNNDGRRVVYGHLRESYVKPGDKVTRDMVIGITGCSGGSRVPHLHVEIRKSNTEETGLDYTIDPLTVLPKKRFEQINKRIYSRAICNIMEKNGIKWAMELWKDGYTILRRQRIY